MNDDYDGPERRQYPQRDHDLLIDIKNKLHNVVSLFTTSAMENVKKFEDHETRIRFLERGFFLGMGALGILQIALKLFFK